MSCEQEQCATCCHLRELRAICDSSVRQLRRLGQERILLIDGAAEERMMACIRALEAKSEELLGALEGHGNSAHPRSDGKAGLIEFLSDTMRFSIVSGRLTEAV